MVVPIQNTATGELRILARAIDGIHNERIVRICVGQGIYRDGLPHRRDVFRGPSIEILANIITAVQLILKDWSEMSARIED